MIVNGEQYEVESIRHVPMCKCGGEFRYMSSYDSHREFPYKHECVKCKTRKYFKNVYPLTIYVDIPLEQEKNMKINSFSGKYYFLSNFYEVQVMYDGLTYSNNEAAFQAQKCANYEDRKKFVNLNPSQAKAKGRSVKLRPDWEDIKTNIMKEICVAKFKQNIDLGKKLIATGNADLEEGNTWGDRIWGTVDGVGENRLGQILMEVREELKKNA